MKKKKAKEKENEKKDIQSFRKKKRAASVFFLPFPDLPLSFCCGAIFADIPPGLKRTLLLSHFLGYFVSVCVVYDVYAPPPPSPPLEEKASFLQNKSSQHTMIPFCQYPAPLPPAVCCLLPPSCPYGFDTLQWMISKPINEYRLVQREMVTSGTTCYGASFGGA